MTFYIIRLWFKYLFIVDYVTLAKQFLSKSYFSFPWQGLAHTVAMRTASEIYIETCLIW